MAATKPRASAEQQRCIRVCASRIKLARDVRGLGQNELARLAGIDSGALSKWMSAKSPEVSLWTAIRIATALRVHMDWLAFGIGPMDLDDDGAPPGEEDSSVRRKVPLPARVTPPPPRESEAMMSIVPRARESTRKLGKRGPD